jgi:hypothetical protein
MYKPTIFTNAQAIPEYKPPPPKYKHPPPNISTPVFINTATGIPTAQTSDDNYITIVYNMLTNLFYYVLYCMFTFLFIHSIVYRYNKYYNFLHI